MIIKSALYVVLCKSIVIPTYFLVWKINAEIIVGWFILREKHFSEVEKVWLKKKNMQLCSLFPHVLFFSAVLFLRDSSGFLSK